MYKIVLINMPFASVHRPSLALTQIKSVLEKKYPGQISVDVLYLNQDFAHYMGLELYQNIAEGKYYSSGLGDWFFRQAAFPELPENTREYFLRYYPQPNEQVQSFKRLIQEKRLGLESYLDKLLTLYGLDQVDLVGFTSMFAQNIACFALARKIKECNPATTIVIGGANCETPMGEEIAKYAKPIDFVFSGPGIVSFTEFVQACLDGDIECCHRIDGVLSKANVTQKYSSIRAGTLPVLSAPRKEIGKEVDLNTKIDLDYGSFLDIFERHFPGKAIEPALLFETSRGCWWGERSHCTFCGLNGLTMNYRSMGPQLAVEQIGALFRYASRCSNLESVDNILPKNYFKEVLPFLTPPSNMSLFYEVKASLSEEDVRVLSQAQVKSIQPGIESLATSTLRLMKKGSTVFQNLALLKYCVLHDVYPLWNLLVGFPGEGDEVYKKYLRDIPLLMHLPPPSGVFPVRFDRYSPYFAQKEQYGLDLIPCDFYELTYPFSKEALNNLAYYFSDRNIQAAYNINMIKWLGKMKNKVGFWSSLWYENDASHLPRLFLQEKGKYMVVYDSRSGDACEHQITSMGRELLECLNKPGRISDLAPRLGCGSEDLEKEVALLQDQGLLFQEEEKYMSLVLPYEPPAMQSFMQVRKNRNVEQVNKDAVRSKVYVS